MSVLEHPTAQALLEQATLSPQQIAALAGRLDEFLHRYALCFYRQKHRDNATLVLQGKLSGLERKTSEPIAIQAGIHRKPIQAFVGWGKWDDEAVTAELRRHVAQEWDDPQAVLTLDGSGFAKKGDHCCGVQRQWCGRLGKVENCQVGLFLGYACRHGHALVDRRLFLSKQWVHDSARRKKTHVPKGTRYREHWEIALDLLTARVQARHRGRVGPQERLAVWREPGGQGDIWYKLSNAPASLAVEELVRAHGEHHRVEQLLEEGKGEVGLGHYEVRSWVGWHHHRTLSLLALWLLALQRQRQGEKKPGLRVSQLRQVFTRLLRRPRPSVRQIAEEVNRVKRRNEEARIYHYLANIGTFPPPRPRCDSG